VGLVAFVKRKSALYCIWADPEADVNGIGVAFVLKVKAIP
jgi:hypothetical protein